MFSKVSKLNDEELEKVVGGVVDMNEDTARNLVKSFIEKKQFAKIIDYYNANPQFKTVIDETLSAAGYAIKDGKVVDSYLG